ASARDQLASRASEKEAMGRAQPPAALRAKNRRPLNVRAEMRLRALVPRSATSPGSAVCSWGWNQAPGVGFAQWPGFISSLEFNMRTLASLVVLGVMGAAPSVLAESWRAKPALEVGSPPACREADVSHLFFDLADTGTELSVKPSTGGEFSAPVGSDGSVN